MSRTLRPYQDEAVRSVMDAWSKDERKVAVVMATGLGKSTVIAALGVEAARMGLRVVMLAHRGELLTQMADTVHDLAPDLEVGIVQADRDDHHHQIVAASFQTIAKDHRRDRLGIRDVILVDEVHHLPAATYLEAVTELGVGKGAFLCGFTATLARADGGLGEVIDSVVFERDIRWGIDHGYLIQPHGLTVKIPDLDLSKVKTVAGDFQASALAEQMEAATEYVVDALEQHAPGRQMLVFAASVQAAGAIAQECNGRAELWAECITGDTPRDVREAIFANFRAGKVNVLTTVQVLTEGIDLPMCDCVVIARPTQSKVLFTQMVGRALRTHPGKSDALVLDLAGTTRAIKLARLVDLDTNIKREAINLDGSPLDEDDPILASPAPPRLKRVGAVDLAPVDLFGEPDNEILWIQATDGSWFVPGTQGVIITMRERYTRERKPAQPAGTGSYLARMHHVDTSAIGVSQMKLIEHSIHTTAHECPAGMEEQCCSVAQEAKEGMKQAEEFILAQWDEVPRRTASWRRGNLAPTKNQLQMARAMGIPDSELMTKARLSDEISIKFADRLIRMWKKKEQEK